jgi:hypothetical protein
MALYTVSPPMLQMGRNGWEERLLGCAGITMLLLATVAVEESEWCWSALLGLLAGFSLSVKETAFIDGLIMATFAGFAFARQKAWNKVGYLAGAFTLSPLACVLWLTDIAGGAKQRWACSETMWRMPARYLMQLLINRVISRWLYTIWQCDPVLSTLGAVGVVVTLATRPRRVAMLWACGIVLAFLALPLTGPNLLNLRFSSAALAPVCLLAAYALFTLRSHLTRIVPPRTARAPRLAVSCYPATVIALDLNWYETVFENRTCRICRPV